MRQGSNGRRPRGRPHRKQHGGGAPRHGNFDSSGPEGRIRGNANQVYEKYIGLARDALSQGDRISAETYFQHAEHYYRIVNARTDPKPNGEGQPGRRGDNGHAEAAGEEARTAEQPAPDSGNGEQPREAPQAPQAEERPTAQGRRRPRQAKAAPQVQPSPQPDEQPDVQPNEDSEPVEA